VKPEPDTLSTVPDDPPAAGPDRALEPPRDAGPIAAPPPPVVEVLLAVVVDGDVVVAEEEPHAESPITPHINAAAVIRRLLLVDRNLVGSESFMIAFLSGGLALMPSGGGTRRDGAPRRFVGEYRSAPKAGEPPPRPI
jgi:hypothetical protein